jgi:hypothetical protein
MVFSMVGFVFYLPSSEGCAAFLEGFVYPAAFLEGVHGSG